MNTRRWLLIVLATALISACAPAPAASPSPEPTSMPTALPPTAVPPTVEVQPVATSTWTAPPTLIPGAALPSVCTPQVTATTMMNVRNGPGTIYSIIGALNQGQTATVDGKNAEGTWWYILYPSAPDGHGWVAGSLTTSNCITSSLRVMAPSALPVPFVAAVTNVVVSVDPSEVNVPGCEGEAGWMTAAATIYASGPMDVQYYFEIEGFGTTKTRTLGFTEYGSQQVSESFRPEAVEGKHAVRLWIEGLDLKTWQDSARYTITCD